MMSGYGLVGLLVGALVLILVVLGIIWLVRATSRGTRGTTSAGGTGGTGDTGSMGGTSGTMPPAAETPLDIIKRRYASGEITKEQFDEMKRNLGV